ncbi:hypothetical protein VFPPC_15400 [Pochonia chlamydosporia 170]|uniref:Uncharacterized protein n=1 Tax=Pochonia chlamydosporia 170 TaxID=1380566 RepID=A0A179G891_METCM|nr:hypothetical protein VFPPC_15400 [Pochonia chlamydosporia 170]OAQ74022.1 hypothetical protein VFPPC_15400 [Pochonia chlamydosporia 170]
MVEVGPRLVGQAHLISRGLDGCVAPLQLIRAAVVTCSYLIRVGFPSRIMMAKALSSCIFSSACSPTNEDGSSVAPEP